jgi:hypothetical protein
MYSQDQLVDGTVLFNIHVVVVSADKKLGKAVEVCERVIHKQDAHVIKEVYKTKVMDLGHGTEEQDNTKVVKSVDKFHSVSGIKESSKLIVLHPEPSFIDEDGIYNRDRQRPHQPKRPYLYEVPD